MMRGKSLAGLIGMFLVLACGSLLLADDKDATQAKSRAKPAEWAMNATIIEACSCPMFCQCYFDTKPAAHSAHDGHAGHQHGDAEGGGAPQHFCKMNNAYKVNSGHFGDVKLDGAKFWASGDLGGDFSEGKMDWIDVTFDPSVTPQQREGIQAILAHLYPVKWNSFTISEDAPIEWTASRDQAVAKLDGGRRAEVVLKKYPGMTDEPIVIKNLKYWGAPRNDGFILMPNEVQALRKAPAGKEPYEFKGTNGFMITFDIKSSDEMKQGQAMSGQ